VKKVIFTLNVNGYSPEITEITFPLFRYYARKIGAEFRVITERKWPEWPVVCEKLQIRELAEDADWVIFFDADTFVNPECIDVTCFLDDETCAHNGQDFANMRHRYDEVQVKDGRNIGTCGWLTVAPRKCFGLWDPPDMPMKEIIERCTPSLGEAHFGITAEHLTDDFIMSRNLARHGYKHVCFMELLPKLGFDKGSFFWHAYTIPIEEKVRQMKEVLWRERVPHPVLMKGWEWFHDRMK